VTHSRRPLARLVRAALLLWPTGLLVALPPPAAAHSTGITTQSFNPTTTGCNACHSGGTAPTVDLVGPATVPAGSTATYELRITTSGTQRFGGFNASAPVGVLATGGPDSTLTRAANGTGGPAEITHSSRKAAEMGVLSFSFLWTAPTTPGTVALRLWGNAVNGNGSTSGDRAATVLFPVDVVAADEPPTPTPTATDSPPPTATPTPTEPPPPPCPGDCDHDGQVTVDAILVGVTIANGAPPLVACPELDANGDGVVTVDDILAAVSAAINGCPV